MKLIRYLLISIFIGLIFVVGFGYGRWYSTRPVADTGARTILYYVDAMHPWYKSDKPGVAPDCGMKLVPVYAASGGKPISAAAPSDAGSIQVNDEQQHMLGVRYGTAEWSTGGESIHAAGRIVPDETRIVKVQARLEGWVAHVSADFTGKLVTRGAPLLTISSPELFAAQQEYLLALKAQTVMQHSSMQESMGNNDSMAEAARQRLRLLNLSEAQIRDIETTQKPNQSFTLYSPASGYVMTRNAFPGQRVTAETELYTLADLRSVWVMADIFEENAQRVRLGQTARITIPGDGKLINAKVTYLQPQVDASTRTMKVRIDLPNPKMEFRPDMWLDVDIDIAATKRLSVPAEAVLDSGTTKVIFVDRGNGYFEHRTVEAGARFSDTTGDRVEILKGIAAGERIVISGTFLMNSESQMKSVGGGMEGMPGMGNTPKTQSPSKPSPSATPDMPDMPDMPGMPAGVKK